MKSSKQPEMRAPGRERKRPVRESKRAVREARERDTRESRPAGRRLNKDVKIVRTSSIPWKKKEEG
ncbi:MAG: hypothetical protein A2428_14860 [Bdellovibrionales bacterium RIFOXYC1_FULL_54_43]|nr:MAG: hypothetical protein A2428_14860 [Bdellovibrionales bacterium RIFOXYC1_FULL_54_43]OFZ83272.1 MAG: hypothetical protein A2603_16225 [Bdellovibrionales bacterium RIFOXYD1_FULL_55_31]